MHIKDQELTFSTALQDKSRINTFKRKKKQRTNWTIADFSFVIECFCFVYDVFFVMVAYDRVLL